VGGGGAGGSSLEGLPSPTRCDGGTTHSISRREKDLLREGVNVDLEEVGLSVLSIYSLCVREKGTEKETNRNLRCTSSCCAKDVIRVRGEIRGGGKKILTIAPWAGGGEGASKFRGQQRLRTHAVGDKKRKRDNRKKGHALMAVRG